MAKHYELVRRHVTINGKSTTIQLERIFWAAIDKIASHKSWNASKTLQIFLHVKPPDYSSSAGWVRYCITTQLLKQLQSSTTSKQS